MLLGFKMAKNLKSEESNGTVEEWRKCEACGATHDHFFIDRTVSGRRRYQYSTSPLLQKSSRNNFTDMEPDLTPRRSCFRQPSRRLVNLSDEGRASSVAAKLRVKCASRHKLACIRTVAPKRGRHILIQYLARQSLQKTGRKAQSGL